jgi:GNAT superfamily N-acetyltransferase
MAHVRAASPSDRLELVSLIREMIPDVDAGARWRWLYEQNPGGRALSWLACEGDRVAGCTSFFPFRMWLDGAMVQAALGGDGYVRPAFRRQGVGAALHQASRDAMPRHGIGCMYGAPGAMNVTPLKRGGSSEVGDVARWVRPLRASALGVPGRRLGAVALATPRHTADLEPMRRLDPRVDEVWAAARTELRLAAVRDAAFYTWRFLDAPSGRQHAFVIVDHGTPIGACAVEVTSGGRSLTLVDLITVPGAWQAGLRAVLRHAVEQTAADRVELKLFAPDGRRRQLWRAGFTERERKPFLCMIPRSGDRRLLDPDRWCYSGADSDLDTLEPLARATPLAARLEHAIDAGGMSLGGHPRDVAAGPVSIA